MDKVIRLLVLSVFIALFIACDKDEPDTDYGQGSTTSTSVSAPVYKKDLTTSDYDGFAIRVRYNNGGDELKNMSCTVYWRAYSSKPSSVSKGDMSKSESMRVYGSTKETTTFEKAHAGYNGGTYIYYYTKCSNSKYSAESPLTFEIIPR